MTVPTKQIKSKYAKMYLEAADLFDKDDFDGCQATCKHNLSDPTLPPYWMLKNYVLHISASGSWHEAEEWYQSAEGLYKSKMARCDPESEVEQRTMREIREDLDQIKGWQEEDKPVRKRKQRESEPPEEELDVEGSEAKPEEEALAKSGEAAPVNDDVDMKAEVRRVQLSQSRPSHVFTDLPQASATTSDPATTTDPVPAPKKDSHAKYESLNRHPSLAIRNKPSKGTLNASWRASRDASFGGTTLSKQARDSIADSRRKVKEQRENPDEGHD